MELVEIYVNFLLHRRTQVEGLSLSLQNDSLRI